MGDSVRRWATHRTRKAGDTLTRTRKGRGGGMSEKEKEASLYPVTEKRDSTWGGPSRETTTVMGD